MDRQGAFPTILRGTQIGPGPARAPCRLAAAVEVFSRNRGVEANANPWCARHRGGPVRPDRRRPVLRDRADELAGRPRPGPSDWDAVLDAETQPSRAAVAGAKPGRRSLEAHGRPGRPEEPVTLGRPFARGRQPGRGRLPAGPRATPRMTSGPCARAGLIHESRAARESPTRIWDKPGSLTEAESERVRLHRT